MNNSVLAKTEDRILTNNLNEAHIKSTLYYVSWVSLWDVI
jgi:hypothetical protein